MILTNEIDFQEALEDRIIKVQLVIDYSLIDFYYLSEFEKNNKNNSKKELFEKLKQEHFNSYKNLKKLEEKVTRKEFYKRLDD